MPGIQFQSYVTFMFQTISWVHLLISNLINNYSNSIHLCQENYFNQLMVGPPDSCLATLKSNLMPHYELYFSSTYWIAFKGVRLLWSGPVYFVSHNPLYYLFTHYASVRLSFMQFHSVAFSDFAPFVFLSFQPVPITHPQYIRHLESSDTPDCVGRPSSWLSCGSEL